MRATEKRERLRAILAGPRCVSPVTVFDALSARVAQSVGCEVGVLSGSVSANTLLAAPDLGLQTLTEFAHQVRSITRVSDLSLVLDSDNGYGNALNAMRCVQELEHAGTAALMIEDVVLPERYGSCGLELVSSEEMVGKLRAALAAREDRALVVLARTASARVENAQAMAARAEAYAATGVDGIFLSGLKSLEQFDAVRDAVKIPIVCGTTPQIDRKVLEERGVRLLLQGHQPVAAVVKALREVYTHLHGGGAPAALKDRIVSPEELAVITQGTEYETRRKAYLA
jgi:carboxyvinyl-carboxyphosphonate phosphorylmutase